MGPNGLGHWLTQETIDRFVAAGFYVIGAHWPGMDGGDEDYGARYGQIAGWLHHLGIARPALYAQSRGGLQLLNFACDHPEAFSAIAALYPVTDPFVYPGAGQKLWAAHGTSAADFRRDRFTPNAKAERLRGKPVRIWHGDRDDLVPMAGTSQVFAQASGAQLTVLHGVGHERLWLPEIAGYLHTITS